MKPSIAVVGTGIAGMGAAYYLRDRFDVHLFEKNDYVGGHTNTVTVENSGRRHPVDTGFMVFNDHTYPNLVRLFEELEVESYPTSMSFGVTRRGDGFSYACSDFSTFFAQRRRLFSPRHWRLLLGIKDLFAKAESFLGEEDAELLTLRDFASTHSISEVALQDFLVPMASAIWSTDPQGILDCPAHTLLTFMKNHRMLGYGIQYQWKTVAGGSEQYKRKLLAALPRSAQLRRSVAFVEQTSEGVYIEDASGSRDRFDYAVVATHADQALNLLRQPTPKEQELLGAFSYNRNPVVLHSDRSVMPEQRRAWASWNFSYDASAKGSDASIHYWMNNLQKIDDDRDYFVSVDYQGKIDEKLIHWKFAYEHPRFDRDAILAQRRLGELNTGGRIFFCGSYFRYGFHEDALWSAIEAVKQVDLAASTNHELQAL